MRPQLFHIPTQWIVANILPLTLVISLLLLIYIVWVWIIKKKDFPTDSAFFFGMVFVGGILVFALKEKYQIPTSLPIYSYGFMLMIGFACAIPLAVYRAKKAGMDPDIIFDISMYIILAGVLGARVFYVFFETPEEFKGQSWTVVFEIWKGGLTFYGGLIGATAVVFLYIWIKKLDTLKLVDILSPPTMLGLGFGRIGCFLNGCCWGKLFSADSWGISWTWKAHTYCWQDQLHHGHIVKGATLTLPVHFTQLYSLTLAWLVAFFLLAFSRYWQKRQGSVFGLMLILYGISRFIVEFFRADNAIAYLGGRFTISQMVSLSGIFLGVAVMVLVMKINKPATWAEENKEEKDQKKNDKGKSKEK